MIYRELGRTGEKVSVLSLGTMTFSCDTDKREAFAILDCACDRGINLIDTAELYPVPPRADSVGNAERYFGEWLQRRGKRSKVLVATKAVGPAEPGEGNYIRGGQARLDRKNLEEAIDGSLSRLRTDYVDLYQLHWPDRSTNYFQRLNYKHDASETPVPIEETLEALDAIHKAGKVRFFGVSNETPWGLLEYLRVARERALPRIVSIQNPYNLLNRSFEVGLAEIAARERVGLLAYSTLAFGILAGKYFQPNPPPGKVMTMPHYFHRYSSPRAWEAARHYVAVARKYGVDPGSAALAFVVSQPFVTSAIVGASVRAQLEKNLEVLDTTLPPELVSEIDALYEHYQCVAP